jgi:hypothetical protein
MWVIYDPKSYDGVGYFQIAAFHNEKDARLCLSLYNYLNGAGFWELRFEAKARILYV